MKKWLVKRYVLEERFVEAKTRKEALAKADDVEFYTSMVERETCVSRDWYNEHKDMCLREYGNNRPPDRPISGKTGKRMA